MLLVLEVPLQPQPDENAIEHDERHDSGIASGPADMLYGLPLLKFIVSEIASKRLSTAVIPVVILGDDDHILSSDDSPSFSTGGVIPGEDRELQCVDNGAYDAFRSPLTEERAKTCYMHCYRTRNSAQGGRRRSWVGTDDRKVPLEANNYSYLREKM